ncbi:unnamed protein product, partial [Polarella glacialis]
VPVDFSTTYVAQRYVHKPFLLDGYKFDLRLYVLVSGCDPLRIFLHRRGLVRLASEQYVEPSVKNLSQTTVHLTNYAINKLNPNFEENTNPDDAESGHKRSWEAVQLHLRREGHDVDKLLEEIEDLIVKTLLAVQPSLSHFYHSCQPDDTENNMCFEILGFDVMMDDKLRPILLEVNHAPSFATESELDHVVKAEVLRDTFTLLGFSPDARRQKKREMREKMEQRTMGLIKKQCMEERTIQEREAAVARTDWEDANLNGYKRLYPSLDLEAQYWHIQEAAVQIWEMLMGGTSRKSVRLTPEEAREEPATSKDRGARAHSAKPGADSGKVDGDAPKVEKRTAEEVREVVERLVAGLGARSRTGTARRRGAGSVPNKDAAIAEDEEIPQGDSVDAAAADEKASASQQPRNGLPRSLDKAGRPEVQVGDVIRVQTNLGWETVTVRAKRNNGKLDIQFKDSEYMRSVLPRVQRELNGAPALGDAPALLEEPQEHASAWQPAVPGQPVQPGSPQNVRRQTPIRQLPGIASSNSNSNSNSSSNPTNNNSNLNGNSNNNSNSNNNTSSNRSPGSSRAQALVLRSPEKKRSSASSSSGGGAVSERREEASGERAGAHFTEFRSVAPSSPLRGGGPGVQAEVIAATGSPNLLPVPQWPSTLPASAGDSSSSATVGGGYGDAGGIPSGTVAGSSAAAAAALAATGVGRRGVGPGAVLAGPQGSIGPHGIQSIVYPANRHHEVRLRQQLQQLISVRPITVKRGKSSLGRPGLSAGGTSIGTNG